MFSCLYCAVKLQGYRGRGKALLEKFGAEVGDLIKVMTREGDFEGILMPRYEFADEDHIVVKLRNGYNVGIRVDEIRSVEVLERQEIGRKERPAFKGAEGLPKVKLIGTGGTIASRVDYRTGGVSPAMTAEDLYALVPELRELADLSVENLFNVYSENMAPELWGRIATEVYNSLKEGYTGVVIAHGTDTMHFTSAALSFAIENPSGPVILVGAQRSSDRPSSDAATNLIAAVRVAARKDFRGVFLSMHYGLDDDLIALHRGVRVRKNHTSRRDAFESIDEEPPIMVKGDRVLIRGSFPEGEMRLYPKFSDKVFLLKFFPGMEPEIVDYLVGRGYKAIILEGTGLGHVSSAMIPRLKEAVEKGVFIGMVSQCIWGSIRMTVYETGRELLRIGVTPLEGITPETAFVKASWLLGQGYNGDKLVEAMRANLRGEVLERRII